MTVVWDDEFLSYDLGPEHPLNPVRLALTMSLSRQLGVLGRPNVTAIPPRPAGEDLLTLVHDPEYLDVVRVAPTGYSLFPDAAPCAPKAGSSSTPRTRFPRRSAPSP